MKENDLKNKLEELLKYIKHKECLACKNSQHIYSNNFYKQIDDKINRSKSELIYILLKEEKSKNIVDHNGIVNKGN